MAFFLKSMHLYVLLQNLKIRIEQGQRSLVLSEQIVSFTVILQLVCLWECLFFVLEGHFGNMNTAIQIPYFMFYIPVTLGCMFNFSIIHFLTFLKMLV